MADEPDIDTDDNPNLNQMLDRSTEKACEKVSKDQMIEKQNVELKRLLKILPFQIFLLVADADGKIDPKEVARFKEFLGRREKHCSNAYTRRMFHATVVFYSALSNRYLGGHIKKDFKMVEKTINYIRMCVSQKVMQEICKDLYELAVAVAEASGGFMGVTSPISKEEQAVLDKLDALFNQSILNTQDEGSPGEWELSF